MSNRTVTDPFIGATIRQYDIVAKLGGGGMGVVYKATDTKLGRAVALKFLPPQWSHDEGAKQRFLREAQAASSTNHPNICVIHDIEQTDDGQLFIVMAYYEGQTLKQKLENGGALPVAAALEIATDVAEGLAKAHAQGVVHRDIKPGNLIVTDDGVKVVDFGLAKFADALQLTVPGSTIGTVAYMAPEQARGEDADVRSDVWALGVVLYEMLTGEVPFKGTYAEAIFHAIKNEPLPPLRVPGHGVPDALEALVVRALEKDPGRRYQSARELARDLRLLQGRTVPLELRTEPLSVPQAAQAQRPSRRRWWRRPTVVAVAALSAMIAGLSAWLAFPVSRVPVAVAPVANQSGYAELDGFRLALTQTLVTELTDSANIRVLPYERLLQILRRFLVSGTDVSSRDVVQGLTTHSSVQFVLIPTLLYENGSWRARVEVRNVETATNAAVYDTSPIVSSLSKDTAHGLMAPLADQVERHFIVHGPRRTYVRDAIRRFGGRRPPSVTARMTKPEAAKALEEGMNAYEQLEYAEARRSFGRAADLEPRNPLPLAWVSRIAILTRQDDEAAKAADQAARLLTPQTRDVDRLFIAALSTEAQRDFATAGGRYRELARRYPDEPAWQIELASFQDRRTRTEDAIASYRDALRLDGHLARPHLELCRLYNRLTEPARAKAEGEGALAAYRALGNRGGEAQALMCLTDMLRLGTDAQRLEARRDAEAALEIFEDSGYRYNIARANNYVALAAEAQGHPGEAAASWEQALAAARTAGNVVLEPLVLMNLGAMYASRLGNQSRALDYHQQSHSLFEKFGDEQRAAQSQFNVGAILLEYGGKQEEGLRDIQNALGVFRKLGDKNFEMMVSKATATAYRYAGRHADAERALNRAFAIARERNMDRDLAALTIDRALSRFELSDYAAARSLLMQALGDGSGRDSTQARIHLGRVHVRLGEFDAARGQFSQAALEIQKRGDTVFRPLLHSAMGELAYESRNRGEARRQFAEAAALWVDDLPEPASVEARAFVGLLDALEAKPAGGRMAVQSSLERARRAGPLSLEARCRVYLARIDVGERRLEEALETLRVITPDGERALGPELQAQVHYWRSRALMARGDRAGAQSEETVARKLVADLRASLPAQYRGGFESRADIHLIIG